MKHKLSPWSIALPLVLASALVLIGADATPSAADETDFNFAETTSGFEKWFFCTNAADNLLDFDGDGVLNVKERTLGTDFLAQDTDFDGWNDDVDNVISRFYIQWGSVWFTEGNYYDYAKPTYCLGAGKEGAGEWFSTFTNPETGLALRSQPLRGEGGRVVRKAGELSTQSGWHVAASVSSNEECSLLVALDRGILTNNLKYAIHYWDSKNASLYVDLLDTNGSVVAEDLYGNLLDGANEEVVVLLDVPTASYTNAALIQLRRGIGEVVVWNGLLYIDENGDGWDNEQSKQLGISDYDVNSSTNGTTNYYGEIFGQTNNLVPIKPKNPTLPDEDKDKYKNKGVIYVDQARGNDSLSGRADIASGKHGPKKTVGKGMVAVDEDRAHTLVIKSGTYNENLNVSGKNVRVVIQGNVKL